MKGRLISFAAGFAAATVFAGSALTALAAEGSLTIRAVPVELLVNGELFHPKDVNGKDAMVFTCNGTTYAPARALAEAYGLSVGYDPERKIAAVNKSQAGSVASGDTAAGGACVSDYESFAKLWTVEEKPVTHYGDESVFVLHYQGGLGMNEFRNLWKGMDSSFLRSCAKRMARELQALHPGGYATVYFSYGSYTLGFAAAYGDYEICNFDPAKGWV